MYAKQSTPFHTLLVPLDRSERAERALPVAERLASVFGSTLLLAQVSEPIATLRDFPGPAVAPTVYQELSDIEDDLRRTYLDRVASEVRSRGLSLEVIGMQGYPAPALLDLIERRKPDLVVMASHGYGGVERWAYGSVTDRILRHGTAPVLVVRPWGDEQRYLQLSRALVPLDGSLTAEAVLDPVRELAGRLLHHVTLVQVVDPEMPAGETESVRGYLSTTREALREHIAANAIGGTTGRCDVDDLVLYGEAEEQILERSADGYDLIILATHGRTGPARWALGSVADRVLQGARIPVFLVRAARGE
ncbi:MAG TPA: universal stress protein [Ktedonobacterales bacterium]